MEYRLATQSDIPGIKKIYDYLFAEAAELQPYFWRKVSQSEKFLTDVISGDMSAIADIFVAEESGDIAGFTLVVEQETKPFDCVVPHRYAYLMDIAVSPEHRGKGIGSKLMEQANVWARGRGLEYIELNVLDNNSGAINFYRHEGFEPSINTMYRKI